MRSDARPLVMFAIPKLDAGGPDRVLHALISNLARERFRVALAVGEEGGRYFDALPADVAIARIGGGRYPAARLARVIDRVQPAILFTTQRMNMTAALALPLSRHRPRHVLRQANAIAEDFAALKTQSLIKHRLAEQATWAMLRRADMIVAQSTSMATAIAGRIGGRTPIATIGNPVDLALVRAAAGQGEASIGGAPALVSVGRLDFQKGYDLLIEALCPIRARHPGAALTIVGEGPARAALTAQAASLGLSDALFLPGHSATPLAVVAAADLFVSSSRYEGFSNALLEAMALGVPVVATDCPGATRDMVIDDETGWLSPSIDAAGIANAVLRALDVDRAAVAARAQTHVAREYDVKRIVAAYERLFETVLEARPHRRKAA
ncbi:glycosyltransferase [Sphingomonas sp. 1P06PA]|uniref:glycosyltransferase n=1 Tax=Sphingomonas sp. 1P06PA TaxID=554121 RepID=UPI0039A48E5A